jgi:hypothetical protein
MILDLESRDNGNVMIHKYLIIILISYNIGYSETLITCYMSECYIIIGLYSPIILHE